MDEFAFRKGYTYGTVLVEEINWEVMQPGHVRHGQDKGVTGVLPLLERGDGEDVLRAIGDQVLIDLISPDPAEDAVTQPFQRGH